MSENETKKATDGLFRKTITVTVGEREYVVKEFAFAKTVKVFQLLSELAAVAGVEQAVDAAAASDAEGEFEDGIATGFISRLLKLLPVALRNGVPAVYKLIGLIVTGNTELRQMEKADDVDVDAALLARGEDIAYEGNLDEVMNLIMAAVSVMGTETLVKNLLPLLMSVTRRTS